MRLKKIRKHLLLSVDQFHIHYAFGKNPSLLDSKKEAVYNNLL